METEIWKDIEWFKWLYKVSNLWRIKSLRYWKEKILCPSKLKYWHSLVVLYKNWFCTYKKIHRLVWIHFLENPLNLPCVLHKDETLDENGFLYNWYDNLWWWTAKDNIQDKYKKWRANNHFQTNHPKPMLWKFWKDHNRSKKVNQYTKDWEFIRIWYSLADVERELWIANASIISCCKWKYKNAGGFIWRYL